MFCQRQKLHIVVSSLLQVRDQPFSQFPVCIPVVGPVRRPPPGTGMDLIDVQRPVLPPGPLFHPLAVSEIKYCFILDIRSRVRPQFHPKSVWIAPIPAAVVRPGDPVLVHLSRLCPADPAFPEIAVMDFVHPGPIPAVKLPDDLNLPGPRRKGAEYRLIPLPVSSQIPVSLKFRPCIKSVKIHNFPLISSRLLFLRLFFLLQLFFLL